MNIRRYSRNEILSISALVGLLVFAIFAAAGTRNFSAANETEAPYQNGGGLYGVAEPTIEFVPEINKGPSDVYVKFAGIDGEVEDADHKNWCEVIAFDQAQMMQLTDTSPFRGRAAPLFDDIRIVKTIDKASPKLAEAVCTANIYPTVEIHVTAPVYGTDRVTYLAYELRNVLITSYAVGVTSQSEDVPFEEVTLSFENIKMTYTEFDANGKAKGNIEYEWTLQ
jgi:type VI secretion system secreted protein Hcp